MSRARKFYDISRTLREGIAVWPGDQEFRFCRTARIEEGESANVSAFSLSAHTGTHIDAPLHLFDSGQDAASIPFKSCVGRARIFSVTAETCITAADLGSLDWRGVERVLLKTGSSDLADREFAPDFVYIDESAAEYLARKNLALVGTDAPSVDPFDSTTLISHKILLSHGTVILEGVWLRDVPPGDYELVCLPLKLSGADGSPVRAVLWQYA